MSTLPAWARRLLTKELRFAAEGMEFDREAAEKLLALLAPRRKNEKQKKTAKDKAEGSLRSREATTTLREVCMKRAAGQCECGCGRWFNSSYPLLYAELDHWFSGSGRRRQEQSPETCWMLVGGCHVHRTANKPSAAEWNQRWFDHCKRYGYPYKGHVEHAQLPGRAAR